MNKNFRTLCVELKYLYVSITRPKTNLIIYDSDTKNRNPIFKYWNSLGLIDVVEKGEEINHPVLSEAFKISQSEEETKNQWRALGIKLFKKKYYDSSTMCFEESGDKDLQVRTKAYMNAEEASGLQSEADTLSFQAKHNKFISKFLRRQKKRESKKLRSKAIVKFEKAGEYFEQIGLYKNAAQCYYTCEEYEKAGEIFKKNNDLQQSAE